MFQNDKRIGFAIIVILAFCFQGKVYAQDTIPTNKTRLYLDTNESDSSVISIDTTQFNKGYIISFQELIKGRIPGLTVIANSGSSDTDYTITNRGQTTSIVNSDIMIIVDNAILTYVDFKINPNDIEKITFLKDAIDTSLYGEFASNGVLIITTKRGTKETTVSYSGTGAQAQLAKKADLLSADEFRSLINKRYADSPQITGSLGNNSTDWQDEIYSTVYNQDHHIEVASSPLKLPMRASFGTNTTKGILKTTDYKRNTLNLSLTPSFFNDYLKLQAHYYSISSSSSINSSYINHDPTEAVDVTLRNPVTLLSRQTNSQHTKASLLNFNLDYRLHFWKAVRLVVNYSNSKSDRVLSTKYNQQSPYFYDPNFNNYKVDDLTLAGRQNAHFDSYLNYTQPLGKNESQLECLIGTSHIRGTYYNQTSIQSLSNGNIIRPQGFGSHLSTHYSNFYGTLEAGDENYFSKLNFNYKNRYILKSTFSINKSWYYVGSTSHSATTSLFWNLKNESFIKNNKKVSDLRYRIGYGSTGLNQTNVLYQRSIHEINSLFNTGLEFNLFDKVLFGSFDYYMRQGENLATPVVQVALQNLFAIGYTSGVMITNNGFEISLNSQLVNTDTISWTLFTNTSINENELINVYSDNIPQGYVGLGRDVQIYKNGQALNSFYLFQQVYDANGKPIEGVYADRNNDGKIDVNDKYIVNSPDPSVMIGISSSLKYRTWEFSFGGRINLGNYVYNQLAANSNYDFTYDSISNGFNNVTPSIYETNFQSPRLESDIYVENASFFKMDYIRLAREIKLGTKIKTVVSLTAQNAFTITNYSGADPEVVDGIDRGGYARPRTYSIGLQLNY